MGVVPERKGLSAAQQKKVAAANKKKTGKKANPNDGLGAWWSRGTGNVDTKGVSDAFKGAREADARTMSADKRRNASTSKFVGQVMGPSPLLGVAARQTSSNAVGKGSALDWQSGINSKRDPFKDTQTLLKTGKGPGKGGGKGGSKKTPFKMQGIVPNPGEDARNTPLAGQGSFNAMDGTVAGDPLLDAKNAAFADYLKELTGSSHGKTFSGDLQDYIANAKKSLPKVSYAALEKAASKQAKSNDTDIAGIYGALGGYITGQGKNINANTKAAASDLKANSTAAADLLNNSVAAGKQSTSAALAAIGGFQGTGQTDADKTSQAQQSAVAGNLAQRLQGSLNSNTAHGTTAYNFNAEQGNIAQQQGAEARTNLKQQLAQALAQYQTKQSEENASNALQALQMGTTNFNNDRSYYTQQSETAYQHAKDIGQLKYSQADQAYQDELSRQRYQDQQDSAVASAAASAGRSDDSNAVKLAQARTNFINTWVKKTGQIPTKQQLHDAGF